MEATDEIISTVKLITFSEQQTHKNILLHNKHTQISTHVILSINKSQVLVSDL